MKMVTIFKQFQRIVNIYERDRDFLSKPCVKNFVRSYHSKYLVAIAVTPLHEDLFSLPLKLSMPLSLAHPNNLGRFSTKIFEDC